MDRRDFLKTTGSAAATAGVIASASTSTVAGSAVAGSGVAVTIEDQHSGPHIGSGARELGLAIGAPDNGTGLGENARRLARRIEELTQGRYRIRILTDASTQDADLWAGSAHDNAAIDTAFSYFAGLPGRHGIAANDLDAWLAIGGGQRLWDDLAMAHGFKPFLAGHSGVNPAIWSRQPLASDNSFAGLRYAAVGLAGDVARGLGAHPVALKMGEAAALAAGQVDVVEGGGAMHSLASGLPAAAKFALAAGINRQGSAQSIALKSGQWERMSATDQAAITAACAEEFRLAHAEARTHETLSWRVMRERHGVELSAANDDLLEAIDRVSDAVVAHAAGSSATAQRINASFMAFRAMLPRAVFPAVPVA